MLELPTSSSPQEPNQELAHEIAQLRRQIVELMDKLDEADSTLGAIRRGEVDAFLMGDSQESRVFTIESADRFYLQLAQEVAHVGTWDFDPTNKRIALSPGMKKILMLSTDQELCFETWWEFLHPDDRARIRNSIGDVLQSQDGSFSDQFRILRDNGEIRWLASRGRLIRAADGTPIRFIGINIDVTEQQFLQASLREADRRKDEFLAMLAHELRNPLFPLMAAGELLKRDPGNASETSRLADGILRQTGQLQRLIDDLLDISRITSGKLRVFRQPMSLHDAVQNAIETSRPQMEVAQVSFEAVVTDEPLPINGDAIRLGQIIANLLTNAAKFTPSGGRIHLSIRTEKKQAVIRIRDTGIGIPQGSLSEIFGLFMQVDSSYTRAQGGLGIGLTLAKTLVELHEGSIEVQSDGLGEGSEFTVRLPLLAGTMMALPTIMEPQTLKAARILVVDDNHSARYLLGRMLEKMGQTVRIEKGAANALQTFQLWKPDIVISDIAMPEMSGYELAHAIRHMDLDYRPMLVALTGYSQETDRQAALFAGFDEHLTKPISYAALEHFLHTATGFTVPNADRDSSRE